VRILFDNVDFQSRSGPNHFSYTLASHLHKMGHQVVDMSPDVQLSIIQMTQKVAPTVLRLDGIYFNTSQDWKQQNSLIKKSYDLADGVIFQTEFNKELITNYFGKHSSSTIIQNGTNLEEFKNYQQDDLSFPVLRIISKFDKVWLCASSWRPHKRLKENIRYFLEFSKENECLVVAGKNPDHVIQNPRIFYVGDLDRGRLLSLYKKASNFLHLAWLDHCPNVVVDAHAAGCHVICSSSGGTKEIAGTNCTLIIEDKWDFSPVELYKPPAMNFENRIENSINQDVNIESVAEKYLEVFRKTIKGDKNG